MEETRTTRTRLQRFFRPELDRRFLLRLAVVSGIVALICTQVLIPFRIQGHSMEPTYKDGGFLVCWRGRYLGREPRRGEVVAIRLAGSRVVLLKRVIALAGDTVSFRNGALFVNDAWVEEPYVRGPSDWNLAPRIVATGKLYVVGDNRSVPMAQHDMGQVDRDRIIGGVVW